METKTNRNSNKTKKNGLSAFIPVFDGSCYFLLSVEEIRILADRGINNQPLNLNEFSQPFNKVELMEFFKNGQKAINCVDREGNTTFWEIVKETFDARFTD